MFACEIKKKVLNFVYSCKDISGQYKLTKTSDISDFGLPFAIFIFHLFDEKKHLLKFKDNYNYLLRLNIERAYALRSGIVNEIIYDKYFLQLLCFTLSALRVLNTINNDPLPKYTLDLFNNIKAEDFLKNIGAFEGKAGSGNFAMFYAIVHIHKNTYLNQNSEQEINEWINLHLENMNKNGLWGEVHISPYIQFQNGYHQYEILNYLQKKGEFWNNCANLVLRLQDSDGQFSPYPGGGGCFDYDAIYFLTSKWNNLNLDPNVIFRKTTESIIDSINNDGGSAENLFIRPRTKKNLLKMLKHIFIGSNYGLKARLITNLKLLSPKHDKLITHWPSREWGESNLWDTWFRHLTVYRICNAFPYNFKASDYGYSENAFIDYPGIGFS